MGHQHQRGVAQFGDRHEILDGIERDFCEHERVDHHGAVEGQQQGVAVGGRLGDVLGAGIAGTAGTVLDDHVLA